MGYIAMAHIARRRPAPPRKALPRKAHRNQRIQPLKGHGRQRILTGSISLQIGGNAADATEALSAIAGQFQGRKLGLTGGANANPQHLTATVEVDRDGLLNVGADGGKALGKVRRSEAISGKPLVIEPLELLELVGFEAG